MSRIPRFFAPEVHRSEVGIPFVLPEEPAHHLVHVLRAGLGTAMVLFDGEGNEASATLISLPERKGRKDVLVERTGPLQRGVGADRAMVTVLQGIPRGEKLEQVLRQCTELGAAALWPVYTKRSVPRPRETSLRERWRKIVISACEQCQRAQVPEVGPGERLEEAIDRLPQECTLRLMAWEGESGRTLGDSLRGENQGSCALIVGPEGGLDEAEVAYARARGFVTVGMGPRILRTETAAPALLAAISVVRGDLCQGSV